MTAIFWNFYSQTITVHYNDGNPLDATLFFVVNTEECMLSHLFYYEGFKKGIYGIGA